MSDQRKPLVGWTYDPEPMSGGWHAIFDVNGEHVDSLLSVHVGIPAPRPPRTGTLGLGEEDTREMAERPHRSAICTADRAHNAAIDMCAADVARWDAEDEAAASAEPETLWVELPLDAARDAVKEWTIFPEYSNVCRIATACRTALEKAGLA